MMKKILIILLVLKVLYLIDTFEFLCPAAAHWKLRANSKCQHQRNYSCLFDVNLQINVFREKCIRPRIVGPGYKYVFQPNPNRGSCSISRYQPFIFNTTGYSDCVFLKSLCNSDGLITYADATTRSDRTCTCNKKIGYHFVREPTNECYCNPLVEDCSCFIGNNSNNKTIGSKDIKCYDERNRTPSQNRGNKLELSEQTRNIDLDNFNYNIHRPANDNRAKAVVCLLILVALYSFVAVTLIYIQHIIGKWAKEFTPGKFNIVECTECSVTVEWYIKDTDKSATYKLHYRPVCPNNSKFLTSAVERILEEDNGRCTYKLKNLEPEKYYELKMSSVYYHLKSHYTEPKTQRTLRMAPRMFKVVDWTDRSVTVEWYIDVSDNCRKFEIVRRLHGTGDWSVLSTVVEIVSTDNNRHCKYELDNLDPDTCYELKMCSVNNNVKSQYTEYKTQKTLKLVVLPVAIHRLQEGDRTRYIKLMQSEKTEKRYYVRIMIVGKESVGKTCLLRRLLNERIDNVTSTDGVDIVYKCKINIEDDKWIIDNDLSGITKDRIQRAIEDTESELSKVSTKFSEFSQTDASNGNTSKNRPEEKSTIVHNNVSSTTNNVKNKTRKQEEINKIDNDSEYDVKENAHITSTSTILNQNEDNIESPPLKLPQNLMSRVFSNTFKSNGSSNLSAVCGLWDFAGQKEFYATHQAFLTSSAIYLLVADFNEDISTKGEKLQKHFFADFKNVGDYVEFWFDTIHCHQTVNPTVNESYNHGIDPPVIVVFTGIDKYEKSGIKTKSIDERKVELQSQLNDVLEGQNKFHHLRKIFVLSNTTSHDNEFESLRLEISKTAKRMNHWGEHMPLKWILLEYLIQINKDNGTNFIKLSDMIKMAKHEDINIHEIEDIMLFLNFQHEVGNIIFFKDVRDFIILKPEWLVNAFRCLVSNTFDSELMHRRDMQEFRKKGQISKSLISDLFRSKCGSEFLLQKDYLIKVMEKLDILVKTSILGISREILYIMPSMMQSKSYDDVCKDIGIDNSNRTSWCCLKFAFLPPAFFNHFTAWLIQEYKPRLFNQLFRGICLFDIDDSGCEKLFVTMSTDTIALQVLSFSEEKTELGSICSNIRKKLIEETKGIQNRYNLNMSFELHFQCRNGHYDKDTKPYQNLKSCEAYYCQQHKKIHQSRKLYLPWMLNVDELNIPRTASVPKDTYTEKQQNDTLQETSEDDEGSSGLECKRSELEVILVDSEHRESNHIMKNVPSYETTVDYRYNEGLATEKMRDAVLPEPETEKNTRSIPEIIEERNEASVNILYNSFLENDHFEDVIDKKEKSIDPVWPPDLWEQDKMERHEVSKSKDRRSPIMHDYYKKREPETEKNTRSIPKTIDVIDKQEKSDDPEWPPDPWKQQEMERHEVSKIKDIKSPIMHDYNKKDVYRLHGEKRGKVFIIHNTTSRYDDVKHLNVHNLKDVFKQLHFEVLIKTDLQAEQMVRFLEDERDQIRNWNEIDCVVLILICSGVEKYIYGIDNKLVKLTDIIEVFDTEQCPYFADDKPRLIFVQAGRNVVLSSEDLTKKIVKIKQKQNVMSFTDDFLDIAPFWNETPKVSRHRSADILVMYAQQAGSQSFTNCETGSWFLNAIVWTFKYYAAHEELQQMLIRVSRIVSNGKGHPDFPEKIQLPEINSNLRKKFYFFPNVYGDPPKLFEI